MSTVDLNSYDASVKTAQDSIEACRRQMQKDLRRLRHGTASIDGGGRIFEIAQPASMPPVTDAGPVRPLEDAR